jgi:hypothetical protein
MHANRSLNITKLIGNTTNKFIKTGLYNYLYEVDLPAYFIYNGNSQ